MNRKTETVALLARYETAIGCIDILSKFWDFEGKDAPKTRKANPSRSLDVTNYTMVFRFILPTIVVTVEGDRE